MEEEKHHKESSSPPVPVKRDAPTQQAIAGGETVTISSVTLGSLLSSLFVTNTAPSAPTTAMWINPGLLQLQYGDFSLISIRFEARAFVPSVIKVT